MRGRVDSMTITTRGRARQGMAAPAPAALVLLAALLGFFMTALDATAVNVALPGIGRSLGGGTAGLQWVVDGYTLMFAALLVSAGTVSDRAGARRVFRVGLVVFVLASAACGAAPHIWFLVLARVVQGSAAAVMMPASLALVRQAFADPARRARAIARWTVGGAVAVVAGPLAGGVLTSAVSWRLIFVLNLPAGVVAIALLRRAPASPRRDAPLDLAGQVTLVLALAALTFGIIEGGSAGFGSPLVLGSLALSVVAAGLFTLAERRAAAPMVPLGLFRSRTVLFCVTAGFTVNWTFYGLIFVFSLFFQRVLGLSPVSAGLMFLPMTALISVSNLASARIAARSGPRRPIWTGLLGAAAGLSVLAAVSGTTDRYLLAGLLVPVSLGLGLVVPSLTAMLLETLPGSQAGLAAGVYNSARQVGGTVGVAVFGALVAQRTSFGTGMRDSLLIVTVLVAATALGALLLPMSRHE
jgi:DHA2 family methylenomycin A resistance protein-like MFS transporter